MRNHYAPGGTTEKEEVEISTSSFFCISPQPTLFQRDFGVLNDQDTAHDGAK